MKHTQIICASLAIGLGNIEFAQTADDEFIEAIETLRSVGSEGRGNAAASKALKRLSNGGKELIPALLTAMDGANSFSLNYLRGAVEVISSKTLSKGESLPLVELGEFLLNKSHDTKPRAMAFDLIRRADANAAERLIPGMLSDPSVDLRREAVARLSLIHI